MINKLAHWIAGHPKLIMIIAFILIIPSAIGYFATYVNYDILSYLPTDLESVQGETVLDETFHSASMSIVVMKDMAWDDMKETEEKVSQIDGVADVTWLGSVLDAPIPEEIMPDVLSSMLYSKDGKSTLMIIRYNGASASKETLNTVKQIKSVISKQCMMSGMSAIFEESGELANKEAPIYIAAAVILSLCALMFTMESFVLPFVLLVALGLAVIYNMGSNIIFGQISYITQCIAAILQLGVTMDYSVFLMDRYTEERMKTPRNHKNAMAHAIASTFVSLAGSSLTTVFGFVALCFMKLTLGLDIGLVMAKGVVLGIVTVVVVLPALLLTFEKQIYSSTHKSLIPSFKPINKFTTKHSKIFAIIFVILIIPAYIGNNNVPKYYNVMKSMPDDMDSIVALNTLKEEFGMTTTHFLIIDDSIAGDNVTQMLKEIEKVDGVTSVLGMNSIVGSSIPSTILPDSVKSILATGGKQMIMINTSYESATDPINAQIDEITRIAKSFDSGSLLTGEGVMTKDLIDVTSVDFVVTNIISIAAIFAVIAFCLKSGSLPVLLVASIELAIMLNMSISTILNSEIPFIAPTVVSCVQLGATVDYAILLTTRYKEELSHTPDRVTAMRKAADSADRSIFQSALVFFCATFGVYCLSDIDIVKQICALLARGSIVSAVVIVVFLPSLLIVSDKVIEKTTAGWKRNKGSVPLVVEGPEGETINLAADEIRVLRNPYVQKEKQKQLRAERRAERKAKHAERLKNMDLKKSNKKDDNRKTGKQTKKAEKERKK